MVNFITREEYSDLSVQGKEDSWRDLQEDGFEFEGMVITDHKAYRARLDVMKGFGSGGHSMNGMDLQTTATPSLTWRMVGNSMTMTYFKKTITTILRQR